VRALPLYLTIPYEIVLIRVLSYITNEDSSVSSKKIFLILILIYSFLKLDISNLTIKNLSITTICITEHNYTLQ